METHTSLNPEVALRVKTPSSSPRQVSLHATILILGYGRVSYHSTWTRRRHRSFYFHSILRTLSFKVYKSFFLYYTQSLQTPDPHIRIILLVVRTRYSFPCNLPRYRPSYKADTKSFPFIHIESRIQHYKTLEAYNTSGLPASTLSAPRNRGINR